MYIILQADYARLFDVVVAISQISEQVMLSAGMFFGKKFKFLSPYGQNIIKI